MSATLMKTILLLEDLPEIRAWLRKLVQQVFPNLRRRARSRKPWSC